MAFLSGPRQVGKTTLVKAYLKQFGQGCYFNWDISDDQNTLRKDPYFFEKRDRDPQKKFLVILDEIHKYARWKNYLKGAYDRHGEEFRFLVTGSGRLDLFKRGGDSLLGRYFSVPIFPLTVGELKGSRPSWKESFSQWEHMPPSTLADREAYEALVHYGGFPEPFFKADEEFYRVWRGERKQLLIREDIRNASNIREISLLEMLAHAIPDRIGSPLSLNALREDLDVAFGTVRNWVELLSRFYYMFRIPPYARSLTRSLKKEPKAYLFDWGEIVDPTIRHENMVALHLLKAVKTWRSAGQAELELYYVRDKEKREVDFLLVESGVPRALVECKYTDTSFASSTAYFQEKLKVPLAIQVVHPSGVSRRMKSGTGMQWVISADRWLSLLP